MILNGCGTFGRHPRVNKKNANAFKQSFPSLIKISEIVLQFKSPCWPIVFQSNGCRPNKSVSFGTR